MTFRERRKRKIRKRRKNIFKKKKGISKGENNKKRVPRIITKKLREKYTDLYFLIVKSFLYYGITNKIIGN